MQGIKIFLLLVIAHILLFSFLFSGLKSEAGPLKFHPEGKTHDEILSLIKKENGKFGLLYFTTDWCGTCKLLERKTFSHDAFSGYVKVHFVPFRIDAEKQTGPELRKKYNIRAYPTVVFINDTDEVIEKVIGYRSPRVYLDLLENIVQGKNTLLSLKKLYGNNPDNEEIAVQYARDLFKHTDLKEAKRIYEKFLRRAKNRENLSEIYSNLASIYNDESKAEQVISILKEGFEKDYLGKRKQHAFYMLADIYFKKEKYADAIDNFKMISKDTEYYYTAQTQMVVSYFRMGNEKEGRMLLDRLFAEAANDINKLHTLAWLCFHMKVYLNEALKWSGKAVLMTNWEKDYLINQYALLLFETGKRGEAILAAKRALELAADESNTEVFKRNLAMMHWRDGNEGEANKLFAELFQVAKNDANKLNELAWSCHEYKVNLKMALGWAKMAAELSEERIDYILNTYANLLFDNGDIQEALRIQNKSLDIATSESRKTEYENNIRIYTNALEEKKRTEHISRSAFIS